MKRLLLVGAGHAHLQVLQAFAAEPPAGVAVALLTPNAHAVYSGMAPGVVAGHYAAEDARVAIAPLCAAAGVEHLVGSATALEAAARRVLGTAGPLDYDIVSLDTGAAPDRDAIPGAREHALFLRPVDAFLALWPRLAALAQERVLSAAVIGAGPAGVEVALAVQHALGARVRVTLLTGGPPPLASFPPRAQRLALQALKRAAITVLAEPCTRIAAGHVEFGPGTRLQCDAPLVATAGVAPAWLAGSGLALDGQGFVATGATLQSTSHPEVFAAGDVAARQDRVLPRDGVQAVRAGPALALNLRRFAAGGALQPHAAPAATLALVSLGGRRAIARRGAFVAEGRWAWWWKDRIDRAWIARFATPARGSR
jgi:pyridine nucleotide-disulfide oxidoreductase family protein